MKTIERNVKMILALMLIVISSFAQNKIDEERMQRDIEVAANVLSTMIKQQFDKRSFFPIEVKATYREGYGVTFTLPNVQTDFLFGNFDMPMPMWPDGMGRDFVISETDENGVTIVRQGSDGGVATVDKKGVAPKNAGADARVKGSRSKNKSKLNRDSLQEESSERTLKAVKDFIADYGDLIGQLSATERIIITNRGENDRMWFGQFNNQNQATYLSVETTKGDVSQYKQGKITRDQLFGKLKIVNTKTESELQPDLELLSSIFNRLYRSDLSKTFFTQENTYYERLKDFGVIYYMQVYSSNQQGEDFWSMPTVSLNEVDQETRDKKVKELYPKFAKNIKEDMLEYGKTLKSLKDDENLILNIVLTRCRGCQIPSTLELTVKNSVLKDYSSGKLTKDAALQKISEKKGAEQ